VDTPAWLLLALSCVLAALWLDARGRARAWRREAYRYGRLWARALDAPDDPADWWKGAGG
jgi:hypothetical protein